MQQDTISEKTRLKAGPHKKNNCIVFFLTVNILANINVLSPCISNIQTVMTFKITGMFMRTFVKLQQQHRDWGITRNHKVIWHNKHLKNYPIIPIRMTNAKKGNFILIFSQWCWTSCNLFFLIHHWRNETCMLDLSKFYSTSTLMSSIS